MKDSRTKGSATTLNATPPGTMPHDVVMPRQCQSSVRYYRVPLDAETNGCWEEQAALSRLRECQEDGPQLYSDSILIHIWGSICEIAL